jgi:large conductance mechanosensitive channel
MFKEFRDFAMRGNVVDLAVGVIIGAAFGAIVSSLVDNIIMPVIGLATSGVDFSELKWVLQPATETDPEVAIGIGLFINAVIKFIIIAFAVFLLVKGMNSMMKKQEEAPAAPPPPSNEEKLLGEIRDLLKQRPV